MLLLTLLFAVCSASMEKFKMIAEQSRREYLEKVKPPPEAENLSARRQRLIDSISIRNERSCLDVYQEIAKLALARTFAIFCAKMEGRSLGKNCLIKNY